MPLPIEQWLERLGYASEPLALHRVGQDLARTHPYALEIGNLLRPEGPVRAKAVFDVEGVPTVVFLGGDRQPLTSRELDEARKRIWNQNLATVVIEVKGETANALPVRKLAGAVSRINFSEASHDGAFSAADVTSADVARRLPQWFDFKSRVDQQLLVNISATVAKLADFGLSGAQTANEKRRLAQLLMGQVMFVAYLEHREIAGPTYRRRRHVEQLHPLVERAARDGIRVLIERLRKDFNGDFLGDDSHDPWTALTSEGFGLLSHFLSRTDMQTGQGSFWNYDFSCIPVELLSGIYESFLTPDQQAKDGAYYTPRNLAVLAVNQALAGSTDPLQETIFDGACGSGILLTTAYRRLIAHAEVKQGRQLGFAERGELLKRRIFGGDINFMACRVTAFSLYLSLLEGLSPADILEAQERDGTKLPSLNGTNLCHGNEADFFLDSHRFAGRLFSLFISNPPWTEPEGATVTTADAWAVRARAPFVRRQIAGAFALRAADFLRQGGRACLILPIGQLLAPSSESFVSHLLHLYRPEQLVNFGDLQALLFPTAENTCHVFVGSRREPADAGAVPFGETFDYCVPKADISLAQGRLTMQSADRHVLQTTSVIRDPSVLVTLMWGDAQDLSIWTRLAARGTFADFWSGPKDQRRWITRKGIHRVDKSRTSVSAEPLERLPYVDVAALKAGSPVFHPELLRPWPAEQYTVVGLSKEVLRVFDGPRVLFPDGFSKEELNIRAVYIDKPASFTHSVGVIAGPVEDAALLKFTAVYLRSSLACYFLMMRGWKMLCERNGVHLSDVESFPFFEPSKAPDPDKARHSIASVVEHLDTLTGADELERQRHYEDAKGTLDEAVFDYFGLSEQERHLILETVDVLMPSIRPRSFKSLNTPAQVRASATEVGAYATTLGNGLTSWRNRMNGEGQFLVSVATAHPEKPGASGIVRVAFRTGRAKEAVTDVQISDQIVLETMKQLRLAGLQTVRSGDSLELLPDAHIWTDGLLYLVRPLTRRSWTTRQALRDAEQIVRLVQANSMRPKAKEAA